MSKKLDEPFRIPSNYLSLAQSAGKTARVPGAIGQFSSLSLVEKLSRKFEAKH